MCRAFERMREKAVHEATIKYALTMLAEGLPCETVAKCLGLPVEEVRALAEKKPA